MEANLTIRRRYVGDIGVMCSQSGPEIDAGGATDGDGAIVMLEGESIVDKILFDQRLIWEGVKMNILIVRQNKDNIGPIWNNSCGLLFIWTLSNWTVGKSYAADDGENHEGD